MRPKTLILFAVAIGCGLIASIGVSQYIDKARINGGGQVETAKIFVATTEISQGERLDAKNISLEEWPRDRIPEGAIADLKQLEEKFSRTRMFKGEPILAAKLADTIDGNMAQTIPIGYRVVAVKVDEHTSAGGLIRPGDRVDLVVFLRRNADIPETGTHTILQDVNVFAVQGETERQVDKQGLSRDLRTVSLLVTPKQAESVMLAKELGILSLALRRPGDTVEEAGDGETVGSLLGRSGESANETKGKRKEADVPGDVAKWLADNQDPAESANGTMAAEMNVVVAPPAPKFVMTIRTNNGDRQYLFNDLDGPPQESDRQMATPAVPATEAPSAMRPVPSAGETSQEPAAADPAGEPDLDAAADADVNRESGK